MTNRPDTGGTRPSPLQAAIAICMAASMTWSCMGNTEHTASAVADSDSLPFLHSEGISTLISDSGIIRYHMVAEEWDIYEREGELSTWKFMKGLFMERFDKDFRVDLFVQSDTAYLHRQQIWELRGRVVIRNMRNEVFHTEELYWDMARHEMWNHSHMRIVTPERELEGTEFRSNEQMTRYSVANSIGSFPVSDTENDTAADTTQLAPADTVATEEPIHDMPQKEPKKRFLPAPDKRGKF